MLGNTKVYSYIVKSTGVFVSCAADIQISLPDVYLIMPVKNLDEDIFCNSGITKMRKH